MYLFIVWQILPLLDCIDQISKLTMCKCCGKPAGLFSPMLFDIKRELFLQEVFHVYLNKFEIAVSHLFKK